MRKTMFIAALLLLAYGAQAQTEVYIGARGGLNIPKLTASGDNPMSKGYSSRLAGNGGIFAEFRFTELFSLQPGIEYTQQGGKRNGMQAIPVAMMPYKLSDMVPATLQPFVEMAGVGDVLNADLLYADFKSETKFDYIMVPILAKFGWNLKNTPIRLYVDAGPFVSFLLKAKQTTKGNSYLHLEDGAKLADKFGPFLDMLDNIAVGGAASGISQNEVAFLQQYTQAFRESGILQQQSMNNDRTITDDVYRVNYGLSANVGLMYELAPRHNLLFEVGGNYGFRKMQKSATHGQNRIGAATVVVGYAYKL